MSEYPIGHVVFSRHPATTAEIHTHVEDINPEFGPLIEPNG